MQAQPAEIRSWRDQREPWNLLNLIFGLQWSVGSLLGCQSLQPVMCMTITVANHSPVKQARGKSPGALLGGDGPFQPRGPNFSNIGQARRAVRLGSARLGSAFVPVDAPEFEAGGLGHGGTPDLPPPQRVGRRGLAMPGGRRSDEAGPRSPSSATTSAAGQGKQSRRLKVLAVGSVGAGRRGWAQRGRGGGVGGRRRRFFWAPRAGPLEEAGVRSDPRRTAGVSSAKPFA